MADFVGDMLELLADLLFSRSRRGCVFVVVAALFLALIVVGVLLLMRDG